MRRVASWFALTWAVAVAAYFLVVPVYATSTSTAVAILPGEPPVATSSLGRETLLGVNGPGAATILLIPVLLAALPLIPRRPGSRRALSAIGALLLGIFVVLASASIGLFYAPALVALALAAAGAGMAPTVSSIGTVGSTRG